MVKPTLTFPTPLPENEQHTFNRLQLLLEKTPEVPHTHVLYDQVQRSLGRHYFATPEGKNLAIKRVRDSTISVAVIEPKNI